MTGVVNTTGARSGVVGTISAPAVGTGTDGYVFTGTGAGVNPAWEAISAGEDEVNFVAYGGSGAVSINNEAKVPFSSVSQSGSAWSSPDFTAPVAGYYWFSFSVYNYNGAQTYAWDIEGSSVGTIGRWYGAVTGESSTASGGRTLSASETVSLVNTSGGAKTIYLSSMDHTYFSGVLINAT